MKKQEESSDAFIVYSNDLEDLILRYIFMEEEQIFYVDIGAGDPESGSVTQMMYENGWASGINIEPQKELYAKLLEKRKKDINIWAVVGGREDTHAAFFHNSVNNSSMKAMRNDVEMEYVPMRTLSGIFEQYLEKDQKISFLKVDVEGFEADVIRNAFTDYRPEIIVIEYVPGGSGPDGFWEYEKILTKNRYYYGMTYLSNRYYVAEEATGLHKKLVPVSDILEAIPHVFYQERVKNKVLAEQMLTDGTKILNAIRDYRVKRAVIWGYGPLGILLHRVLTGFGVADIHILDQNADRFDQHIDITISRPEDFFMKEREVDMIFLTFPANEAIRPVLSDYQSMSVYDL